MWMPRLPVVFGRQSTPRSSNSALVTAAAFADHLEGDAGAGVEVDAELVGVLRVGGGGRPDVEPEAAHVHRPQHVGHVDGDEGVGGGAVRACSILVVVSHGSALVGATRFWKKLLPVAPSGNRWSSSGRPWVAARKASADREVVAGEVELRLTPLREHDLARVRDAHVAAGDREHLDLVALGHDGDRTEPVRSGTGDQLGEGIVGEGRRGVDRHPVDPAGEPATQLGGGLGRGASHDDGAEDVVVDQGRPARPSAPPW